MYARVRCVQITVEGGVYFAPIFGIGQQHMRDTDVTDVGMLHRFNAENLSAVAVLAAVFSGLIGRILFGRKGLIWLPLIVMLTLGVAVFVRIARSEQHATSSSSARRVPAVRAIEIGYRTTAGNSAI